MCALEGKDVLAIRVPRGRSPVGTADGRYLRRALGGDGKPACVPFHFHEMNARQADFGTFDYSAMELPGLGLDSWTRWSSPAIDAPSARTAATRRCWA